MSALVKALVALVAVASVVFTYGPPHTVDELSEADFKACSFASPKSSDTTGSTAVTFDKAGTRYFACAAGSHCNQGQKVAITVADSSAPATPTPTPNRNSAAPVAGAAGLAAKLALGLGVGGALLAAF